jgi:hypothetical protein
MSSRYSGWELPRDGIARNKAQPAVSPGIFNDRFRCESIQLRAGAGAGLFFSFFGERPASGAARLQMRSLRLDCFCCANNQKALTNDREQALGRI